MRLSKMISGFGFWLLIVREEISLKTDVLRKGKTKYSSSNLMWKFKPYKTGNWHFSKF